MPGQVGSFPNMRELNRRTIRGPVNPLDKSTLVSIYPKPIRFKNLTLTPGIWNIEAGSFESPSILLIGPSSWWKDVGPDEGLYEIPQGSVQIAESLVKDYCNGMFCCDMNEQMPGIFYVPGEKTVTEIRKEYKSLLDLANRRQSNYYRALLKHADSLWARTSGNPLVINEEMKTAARSLGTRDKDWMKDFQGVEQVRCFACGAFKSPEFPICQSCRTIDPSHAKAKLIQTAP